MFSLKFAVHGGEVICYAYAPYKKTRGISLGENLFRRSNLKKKLLCAMWPVRVATRCLQRARRAATSHFLAAPSASRVSVNKIKTNHV